MNMELVRLVVLILIGCCAISVESSDDTLQKFKSRSKRYLIHEDGGWDKTRLSYYIAMDTIPKPLKKDKVRKDINKAFNQWARISGLTFRKRRKDKADIIIKFMSFADDTGTGQTGRTVFRYATVKYPSGGGDITLNSKAHWTINEGNVGYNLFQVFVRLVGRALGLKGSLDKNAVMYGIYTYKKNWKFGQDDIDGINFLYPKKKRR